jgi:hypothetical protein
MSTPRHQSIRTTREPGINPQEASRREQNIDHMNRMGRIRTHAGEERQYRRFGGKSFFDLFRANRDNIVAGEVWKGKPNAKRRAINELRRNLRGMGVQ